MSIINLDAPAQGLENGPPSELIPLRKSSPPRKTIRPNKTTICIISFFLFLAVFRYPIARACDQLSKLRLKKEK